MWVFTNSIKTVREKIHLRAWERHSCSVPHPWVQPAVRRHIPSRQTYTEHVYTPHPYEYTHPATWIKQTPRALTWTHSVLRASSCSPLIIKSHNKSYFIPKCIPPASHNASPLLGSNTPLTLKCDLEAVQSDLWAFRGVLSHNLPYMSKEKKKKKKLFF